mmetsp:Transcript_27249/g.93028  ORF Transcript_27249/g.93028 Transcript_27249/m.93028 type:complete len:120 (-) Transcript_27249:102-461(-)
MADAKQNVSIRFRRHDGGDIGPFTFNTGATLTEVKEQLLAGWPKEEEAPGSIAEVRIIHSGRILEGKTLADARVGQELGYNPDELITMHVVVRQPQVADGKADGADPGKNVQRCGCAVM